MEWSQDWAKRWALLWSATTWPIGQFHWEFHFPMKTKSVVTARYLQSIKTFLTVELSQYRKSGSMFSSSEPARPAATAADSETPCVCARPSDPPKLCRSAAPKTWPFILQSNPSIVFSNSLRDWLPDYLHWLAGARTWTQTWTLPPDQWVVVVLSAPKPQNKIQ